MVKRLVVINNDGYVSFHDVFKLSFLFILSALALVTALAVNETIQMGLGKCIKKDCIFGYVIYCMISFSLIILFAYIACRCYPDLAEHIDLSRK